MMPSKEELKKEREEIVKIMNILDKTSLNPMYKAEVATMLYGNNCRMLSPDDLVVSKSKYASMHTQEEYDKACKQAEADIIANTTDTACKLCVKQHEYDAKFAMADSIWYYLERFIALTKEDYDYRVRHIIHGDYDVDD